MHAEEPTPLTILLVDDSRTDREIYKLLLSRARPGAYRFIEAECAAHAIALAARNAPDCLVIDYVLPDGNGIDAYRQMRRDNPAIPAILVTGAEADVGFRALEAGFQDFLTKGETDRRVVEKAIRYAIERKRAEQQNRSLREALEQQQRLSTLQRDFITVVSHEFRGPLAIIHAAGRHIGESANGDRAHAMQAEKIIQSAARLENVIDRVFQLCGIEQGAIQPSVEPCDLPEVLEKTIRQLELQYPGRVVERYLSALPERCETDGVLLGMVLSNLIGNALKYSAAPVAVRAYDLGQAIEIEVADSGIGIPAAELGGIWEKYRRGSNAGGAPGSGIGLYLARNLALLLGGTLSAESREGEGATFRLSLPMLHCTRHNA